MNQVTPLAFRQEGSKADWILPGHLEARNAYQEILRVESEIKDKDDWRMQALFAKFPMSISDIDTDRWNAHTQHRGVTLSFRLDNLEPDGPKVKVKGWFTQDMATLAFRCYFLLQEPVHAIEDSDVQTSLASSSRSSLSRLPNSLSDIWTRTFSRSSQPNDASTYL